MDDGKLDLKKYRETVFVMSEPARNERLEVFGVRYQVWQVILQDMRTFGWVKSTQLQISIKFGISERAMQKHFAAFKEAGMIERVRNPQGEMKFKVCPEHYWNYKTFIRDKHIAHRRKAIKRKTPTGNELRLVDDEDDAA